ncbi:MAG: hypothetical protein NUW00_01085 [Candidatus Kaiserbacteria bacterium]|nr:hypothetical protein [Candidatus Kaiserbacteria bacterium]
MSITPDRVEMLREAARREMVSVSMLVAMMIDDSVIIHTDRK